MYQSYWSHKLLSIDYGTDTSTDRRQVDRYIFKPCKSGDKNQYYEYLKNIILTLSTSVTFCFFYTYNRNLLIVIIQCKLQAATKCIVFPALPTQKTLKIEPVHKISNNVVCETSKASDQPAHTRSLIRAFASRLSILRLFSYLLDTIWSF